MTEGHTGIMNIIQVSSQAFSMLTSLSPLLAGGLSVLKGGIKIFSDAYNGIGTIAKAGRLMSAALNTGKLSTYTSLVSRYGMAGRIAAGGIWMKNAAETTGKAIGTAANAVTSRAFWLNMRHATATKLLTVWTWILSKARLAGASIMTLFGKRTALLTLLQGGLTKALRLAKVTMLTGVIPALTGVIAATTAWTVALLANPITWIVLAIAALIAGVVLCWQKFAEFRAVILTIWDAILGFGKAIFEWVVSPFKVAWKIIGGLGKALGALFTGDFSGAWDSLKEGFGGAVDEFKKPIETAVKTTSEIGGNYDRHLAEERAKQEQKEKNKSSRPQISGYSVPDDPDNLQMPQISASSIAASTTSHTSSASVSMQYNPSINISSEMTQKSREDLMKILKDNAAEFARIIQEEFRRSDRGAYGLS